MKDGVDQPRRENRQRESFDDTDGNLQSRRSPCDAAQLIGSARAQAALKSSIATSKGGMSSPMGGST